MSMGQARTQAPQCVHFSSSTFTPMIATREKRP
jgi:hypothetical protein